MSANLKKHLAHLSKRGPHRVLVGDLGYAGIPGKIYTPAEGNGVPGVAFGHDWTKPVAKYHGTLRHLASWGIAVAAPDTERGVVPNHRGFSADLETTLQILGGVKLGQGNVTVSPGKLGVVGHGMGGGAAVLTAANNPKVTAVGAVYPAEVTPSSYTAAGSVTAPGLVIGSSQGEIFGAGNPAKLAYSWAGPVAYRELQNGNQQGFSEDTFFKLFVGLGLPQFSAQETARGLLTGFLLHQLDEEKKYSDFSERRAEAKNVTSLVGADLAERAGVDFTDVTVSGGSTAQGELDDVGR
ncbi:hypothetical protein B841_02830 [Corynebacterium maris DSM 45190]|uniref:PET hydrolase/cutinase-like domain-containing protein n=1 Tax=Corynebacterium maris DSM 45190 TaxID=1224163 RepID=S5SSF5_9CORY|nr:dienelactone hydrolase family protein [Corynebacterium maris]AGS34049.1 hypothetical protein B841_02830 [Corynebacterium maris DSM 45190]